MKISSGNYPLISTIFVLLLLGGCSSRESGPNTAITNPASEHCVKEGGKLEIIKDASGEKNICHLPDGSTVEEWELFRRDNQEK